VEPASDLFSVSAVRAMSATLMRLNAIPNSISALAKAGMTTLFKTSDPPDGSSTPSTVPAARRISFAVTLPFPREFVAAARTADAFQNAFAHQRPQHRLKVARRQAVPRRQGFRCNRMSVRLQRDVDDRCNGEDSFSGEQWHELEGNISRGK
jgi:hypothetical protein